MRKCSKGVEKPQIGKLAAREVLNFISLFGFVVVLSLCFDVKASGCMTAMAMHIALSHPTN